MSSILIGTLLIEAMTIWRISRMRRFSSSRSLAAACTGSFSPSTCCTGSWPPPNRPTLRTLQDHVPLDQEVAADVGVAVGQCLLQLLQGDAVARRRSGSGWIS